MAAVSCTALSLGSLNLHAARAQTEVCRSSGTSNRIQLAWNPLQVKTASSSCTKSYLSSSFSGEQLLCRSSRMPGTVRRMSLKASSPTASCAYDEDDEVSSSIQQAPELFTEAGSEKVEESAPAKNWTASLMGSAAKPAVVALLVALLAAQPSEDALAASSGGRMGGKAFSRPSAPPSRSYSPGGGGGGGGRSYGGGGGGGMYVAPPTYGYGSPFGGSPFGYSPFYGGGYGGGAFLGPSIGFGGGGTIILAMIAFATLRSIAGAIRNRFGRDEDEDRFDDQ